MVSKQVSRNGRKQWSVKRVTDEYLLTTMTEMADSGGLVLIRNALGSR